MIAKLYKIKNSKGQYSKNFYRLGGARKARKVHETPSNPLEIVLIHERVKIVDFIDLPEVTWFQVLKPLKLKRKQTEEE